MLKCMKDKHKNEIQNFILFLWRWIFCIIFLIYIRENENLFRWQHFAFNDAWKVVTQDIIFFFVDQRTKFILIMEGKIDRNYVPIYKSLRKRTKWLNISWIYEREYSTIPLRLSFAVSWWVRFFIFSLNTNKHTFTQLT